MTNTVVGDTGSVVGTMSAKSQFDFRALVNSALSRPLLAGGMISIHDHRASVSIVGQTDDEQALLDEWNLD